MTGTLSGFETDENGNVSFNPARFVMGFVGGAGASKVVRLALDKNPNLRKRAIDFTQKAFNNVKDSFQNANTRELLEQVFSKELIKALDNRAFIVGSDTNKNKICYNQL